MSNGKNRHDRTPLPIAHPWMEDCPKNWRRAALVHVPWNFRQPFGPLDSERPDVANEVFRGPKPDRKMLELLLSYHHL